MQSGVSPRTLLIISAIGFTHLKLPALNLFLQKDECGCLVTLRMVPTSQISS